ncbi:MAG: hypothetical protein EZS28_026154 [Streblomastix strix]|uniref:TmcB/TmcC TPR repeats domain-containing protein n=1 Tax=Streblomastix strix TaxID=222440 RepID=A0A5J4V679_9EUKA|nr:MAG: hypothetical protein EZS28_026154 [Streblomastix strix]
MIFPIVARSFFHAHGNALQAGSMGIVVACYIMGTLSEIMSPNDRKMWMSVILWLIFLICIICIPVGVYYLTYRLSMTAWAIREGDLIPDLPNKNKLSGNVSMKVFDGSLPQGVQSGYEAPISARTPNKPTSSAVSVPYPQSMQSSQSSINLMRNPQSNRQSGSLTPVQQVLDMNNNENKKEKESSEREKQTPTKQIPQYLTSVPQLPDFGVKELQKDFVTSSRSYQGKPKKKKNIKEKLKKEPIFDEQTLQERKAENEKRIKQYKTAAQFQQSIRFMSKKKYNKRKEAIRFAEELLYLGIKRAPTESGQDSGLWLTISIFHKSFTKNLHKMGEALRSCRQNIPSMVERWMIYALMHDLERENAQQQAKSGQGQGSNMGVAFRSKMARAERAHDLSKAYLGQAYLFLSKQNLDLVRIMHYLDNAIQNEYESHNIYDELIKEHGATSVQLLRAFGALLRDIYRDDDTALTMFNEATAIEEEMAANSVGGGAIAGSKAFNLVKVRLLNQYINILLLV